MKFWGNRRKAVLITLLATVLLVGFSTISLAKSETVKVATNATYAPFEWRDKDSGKIIGYDMDILKAVTKRAGLDYELKLINFNGIIPGLLVGQVDMAITGMTITDNRKKKVDFSEPYYDSGVRILVRADNQDIHSIDDLKGRKVGTETGTTAYHYLTTHYPDLKLQLYPASSEMYMALDNGNVDAVLFDEPSIAYYVKTKGKGQVKTVGPLYEGEYYGIAFPKDSPLRARINTALTAMKKDGTLTEIYEKWFDKKPSQALLEATE